MSAGSRLSVCFLLIGCCLPAEFTAGQIQEEAIVQASNAVLNESMALPVNQIPGSLLANASGVAIIPNVIKGSFIVGARHGRGLLFVREKDGIWHAPVFISLTGGNIGWQVGVQSSDIILVFKTPRSVQGILSGKLTIGADVAAAAGPIGRQGSVATDGQLKAEIYSYSRSRGLFAGVSIDGSALQIDQLATGNYYRSPGPGLPVIVPPSALQLTQRIAILAGNGAPANETAQTTGLAEQYRASETEILRQQLAQLAPELYDILDPQWKAYLAIPASIYLDNSQPDTTAVAATLNHFARVATDPQFQQLADRPEFQSVYGLLKHYQQSLSTNSSTLNLPPPPAAGTAVVPR